MARDTAVHQPSDRNEFTDLLRFSSNRARNRYYDLWFFRYGSVLRPRGDKRALYVLVPDNKRIQFMQEVEKLRA